MLDGLVIVLLRLLLPLASFIDFFKIILIATCIKVIISIVLFDGEFILTRSLGEVPVRRLLHLLVDVWISSRHWSLRQVRPHVDNVILISFVRVLCILFDNS